jgi:hypothetical protein
MGIDYSGILIYGIKHEWDRNQVKYIERNIMFEGHGIWSINYKNTTIFFCSIPGMFDSTRYKFIGLRCYQSPDYTPIEIDLNTPELHELIIMQEVCAKLGIQFPITNTPRWYLMPRGK